MHGRLDTVGWARAVQANDTAAHRLYRANRTAEETATVQANDTAAHRLYRANRTAEETATVQANDAAAHRLQRVNRTAEEADVVQANNKRRTESNVSLNKLHVPQTTSAKRTTKTLRRPRAADRYVPFPPGGLCPPGSPHDRYLVLGLAVSVDTVYLVTIYLTQCTWKRSVERVYLATIYGNCCLCHMHMGHAPSSLCLPLPPANQ